MKKLLGIFLFVFLCTLCLNCCAAEKKIETKNISGAETGLVGYWNFDEGEGKIAKDISGKANNAEINEAEWVDGIKNKALEFYRADDCVEIPISPSLNITGNKLTMEAWIFPKDWEQNAYVISIYDGAKGQYGMGLTARESGNLKWYIFSDGVLIAKQSSVEQKLDSWHHFATSYDGSAVSFYWDGELVDSQDVSGNIDSTDMPLLIGKLGGLPLHFVGVIDEVKIYDRALSADEIKAHYQKNK